MIFTERIYDVFEDESIGWEAARAIGEIVTPDAVLTKANHAEIKVCYHIFTSSLSPYTDIRYFLCKNM